MAVRAGLQHAGEAAQRLGLLYQDLIERGETLPDGRLPPVLPIVLYNGDDTWVAPQDISELIPAVPGLVGQYKPQLKYFLIDEHTHSDTELASQKNLVAAIFRFEHSAPLESLPDLVGLLKDWLADQPELGRMIARWLRATLRRKAESTIVLPEIDDLQELRVMLADRIERWGQDKVQQGVKQGLQKGLQQGEALALQRLLVRRFGAIPPAVTARIGEASQTQIEAWFDAAIDAPTLDAVFVPKG